jgi:hypothetical protein
MHNSILSLCMALLITYKNRAQQNYNSPYIDDYRSFYNWHDFRTNRDKGIKKLSIQSFC